MNHKKLAIILVLLTSLTVSLGMASAQITDENSSNFSILGGLVPDSNTTGPVANVGAEYKFDDGFYQKIQDLILEEPQEGDFGVYDSERYYNVIMVVSRDDGDSRDPDETAKENKDSIVGYLNTLGARDIVAAESLSFVTASIPVAMIPEFSLHEEIYQMGDGEMSVTVEDDTAMGTIHATPSDLRQSIGSVPDGTGVVVAVVDTGINSIYLNSKVVNRAYCDGGCREQPNGIIIGMNKTDPYHYSTTFASHGTQVAQILAASDMPNNNGMSPGVTLLDAMHSSERGTSDFLSSLAHSIDWSYSRGADVVNVSLGHSFLTCGATAAISYSMIINEAVDKGMVVIDGAGNNGFHNNRAYYESITSPTCAHNVIAVGGINDRGSEITMYTKSSRGPISTSDPRLAPHIVAPAYNIQTLDFPNNASMSARSGTSAAAPQASAAAAMLLQVNPELTPAEVKAALLLGADWTGPVPCTSTQYEQNNASDNCSYAKQPSNSNTANNAASLKILNNVGFGILNVAKSLKYADSASSHIISSSHPDRILYRLNVTDTSEPVKVILTWMAHPHGGIAEQRYRGNAPVQDLNFFVSGPDALLFYGTSRHQNTEFVVFDPPTTGEYFVYVYSGYSWPYQAPNKPAQVFALASNAQITPYSSNRPPVAQSDYVVVSPGMPVPVRLHATDVNGDAVTFHVSRDPTQGTVTADELITTSMSRVIYTPDDNFTGSDTFQVTPHDGRASGTPATITLVGEWPQPWVTNVEVNTTRVKDWDSYEVTHEFFDEEHSNVFAGVDYPVSALYLSSVNMEGIDLWIAAGANTWRIVAIPSDGERMIEFASPIMIPNAAFNVDGIDEEVSQLNQASTGITRQINADYNPVRVLIGYVPSSCTATSSTSCPTQHTYSAAAYPDMWIYERVDGKHTSSTIKIAETGTITGLSVSVDIDHNRIGDLGVYLIAPDGTSVALHDRSGGSRDNIKKTYRTSANTALAGFVGSGLSGDWTLLVDDYISGVSGTLNSWSIKATYSPGIVSQAQPAQTTVFSDDFELTRGHAVKWVETGGGSWQTRLARNNLIVDQQQSSNPISYVLHSANCRTTCTVTLRDSIDLTGYSSATLSFWRSTYLSHDKYEYLDVELYDGSRWNTIHHWPVRNEYGSTWHYESYNLAPYLDTSDFKIRFVTKQSDTTGNVKVDGVVIKATSRTGPG